MADLPKGRITGRFMHITADSEDGDANPDFTPAAGSVIIAPMVPVMRFPGQTPPLVGLMEPIICPVIGGLMYRPGTDATDVGDPLALGVTVPASDQPDGNPKVMLYEATFMFENRDIQPAPVAFMVPTDGVVDLSVPIPAAPEQPAIVAVSYVDAAQAIAANAAAQGWATSASLKADNAAASASAAAASATAAAGSAGSINWAGLPGKPAVIAAGATAAEARTAIGAAEQQATGWTAITVLPAQATGEVVVSKVGDAVLVSGELTAVAAWGSGWVVANNIPAAYRPPVTRSFMVGNYRFNITSAGGLMCMSTIAKDTTVYISGLIRL